MKQQEKPVRTDAQRIEAILELSEHAGIKRDMILDIIREKGEKAFIAGKAKAYEEIFAVFRSLKGKKED